MRQLFIIKKQKSFLRLALQLFIIIKATRTRSRGYVFMSTLILSKSMLLKGGLRSKGYNDSNEQDIKVHNASLTDMKKDGEFS